MTRFNSPAQALKRFIDAGDMGDIYFARAQAMRRRGIPGWGVFTQKDKQGGGPLIDIGVHILDLTLWLMGHPKPTFCSGQTYAKFGPREGVLGLMGQWDPKIFTVEDFAVGLVRFENGATLVLEFGVRARTRSSGTCSTRSYSAPRAACSYNPCKMFFEKHQTLIDATPRLPAAGEGARGRVKAFVQGDPGRHARPRYRRRSADDHADHRRHLPLQRSRPGSAGRRGRLIARVRGAGRVSGPGLAARPNPALRGRRAGGAAAGRRGLAGAGALPVGRADRIHALEPRHPGAEAADRCR